ncbi:cytochrome P450 [Branchiibius hedensis]|uniref:Cytochrome P450 n=1 Tax=Branchiibius hedensis TaxID=672460 RepID=A0A2Y8ZL46_9MICO|nr:cytochrome P450 [Branchiibius hedensis]PWJ24243.1 cytochrome P450 [Branchiibius hedensis]SSA33060.1 Cytochrome P450 [Branchiibius hedensis]
MLDTTDTGFIDDPYPTLAALRAECPVLWHDDWGMFLATTHSAVTATLKSRDFGRIWSDFEPEDQMAQVNSLHRNQLMENEPPAHTRLRRLVAGAFGRGHVERMRPRVTALAEELIDAFEGGDIMSQYAEPLPVFVIADLLGVPRTDHTDLRRWSQAIVHLYEPSTTDATKAAAAQAAEEFSAYVRDVVAFREQHPSEDLITDLLTERAEGDRLSEDELVATVVLLLNAGHEASVNAFGNGLVAALEHPDQWRRLVDGTVDVVTATEEWLRFDAPLQLFERTAVADTQVAGVPIAEGQKIACLMGSANRDQGVFGGTADEFDLTRDPNPHVGFGLGRHFCVGAPLARVELQASIATVVRRFPALQLTATRRRPTWVLRGYEAVEVFSA